MGTPLSHSPSKTSRWTRTFVLLYYTLIGFPVSSLSLSLSLCVCVCFLYQVFELGRVFHGGGVSQRAEIERPEQASGCLHREQGANHSWDRLQRLPSGLHRPRLALGQSLGKWKPSRHQVPIRLPRGNERHLEQQQHESKRIGKTSSPPPPPPSHISFFRQHRHHLTPTSYFSLKIIFAPENLCDHVPLQ